MSFLLPAVAAWQAYQLGFDLKDILEGLSWVGAYLSVVGWIIWGEDRSATIKQRVHQIFVQVLSNIPAVTTLALFFIVLNLFFAEVRVSYDLKEFQRENLSRYSTSLLDLSVKMTKSSKLQIDKIFELRSQVEALKPSPDLGTSSLEDWTSLHDRSKYGKFNNVISVIGDYALSLQPLGMSQEHWAKEHSAIGPGLSNLESLHSISSTSENSSRLITQIIKIPIIYSRTQFVLKSLSDSEQPLQILTKLSKNVFETFRGEIEDLQRYITILIGTTYRMEHLNSPERLKLAEVDTAAAQFSDETQAYYTRLSEVLDLSILAAQQMQAIFAGDSTETESIGKFADKVKQL